jgi:hypothetical protein
VELKSDKECIVYGRLLCDKNKNEMEIINGYRIISSVEIR